MFVPATRPERIAKALASGADAVIVDLEDAVAPHEKDAARQGLPAALATLSPADRARLLVRINAGDTPWFDADLQVLAATAAGGLGGAMLPKADSLPNLARVAQAAGPASLVPLIESVAGWARVRELAAAPQVVRLAFGHLDFQVDAGIASGPGEEELVPVRLELVIASRLAGIAAPVDGVTVATDDAQEIDAASQRARRLGFGGKLCIHPAQVASVNAAFSPSEAQREWARRVLEAARTNPGVFQLDGRMVDGPVIRLARRVLDAG
nr:CoA ester lyase [Ramlibacter algicola]